MTPTDRTARPEAPEPGEPPESRGRRDRPENRDRLRVVMLVGNFIDGDSRVQKEARSAASAGWDAYLVGRSPTGERQEYALGAATVIRAAEEMSATRLRASRPHRRGLKGLLAYPSLEVTRVQHQRQRYRRFELSVDRELAERRAAEASALRGRTIRAASDARSFYIRAWGYWVTVRKQAFDANYEAARREPSSRFEVFRAKRDATSGSWTAQPRLVDFEEAFGRLLDELQPDLIHANDADTLAIAVRAKLRQRRRDPRCQQPGTEGREVKVVYDAHEYFAGETREGDASWTAAIAAQEERYLPFADGVSVAVDGLVPALVERYGLTVAPTVVANMPMAVTADQEADGDPGVRGDLGLGPDVPLLVHAGAVTPIRGLEAVIGALALVPEAHFALLAGSREGHVATLVRLAETIGVRNRFHLLDYVEPDRLTGYLASATIGVEALLHTPNHEVALTTKFWSYLNAHLPILVSDVRSMAAMTHASGVGEVFIAGDADSAATGIRALIGDRERYVAAYESGSMEQYTWERQAKKLLDLYARVMRDSEFTVASNTPSTTHAFSLRGVRSFSL